MYNHDYYATLDQYKLSPSIVVGAEEGAPVTCSVKGKVYSVEEDPQTGTTLTMELGDGYQAVYGQLKDLTVKETLYSAVQTALQVQGHQVEIYTK